MRDSGCGLWRSRGCRGPPGTGWKEPGVEAGSLAARKCVCDSVAFGQGKPGSSHHLGSGKEVSVAGI